MCNKNFLYRMSFCNRRHEALSLSAHFLIRSGGDCNACSHQPYQKSIIRVEAHQRTVNPALMYNAVITPDIRDINARRTSPAPSNVYVLCEKRSSARSENVRDPSSKSKDGRKRAACRIVSVGARCCCRWCLRSGVCCGLAGIYFPPSGC